MRKITLKIKTRDYLDFLRASNESGKLTAEDLPIYNPDRIIR
ncbi:hypothetical protein [Nitrosopumilus sp. b1]|nr:hypothetical protein [Nitrosopumilus sp. b1]